MASAASQIAVISPEPIYDWQEIPQGLQVAEVAFFRNGLDAGRTVADTNVETGGQLPSDRLKAIGEIVVMAAFVGDTAAALAQAQADMHALATQSAIVVHHNSNPILRVPTGLCGGGFGVTGVVAIGDDAAGSGIIVLGNPGAKGFVIPPADWIPIKGGDEHFVTLEWSGAAPPSFAAVRRIAVAINGPLATKGGR